MILNADPRTKSVPGERKCHRCSKHSATVPWLGKGGSYELSRGWIQWLCVCCAAREHLEYAEERAALIPQFRRELAESKSQCAKTKGEKVAFEGWAELVG